MIHHIYRQEWQRLVNNRLKRAGYSFHHSPEAAELYIKQLAGIEAKKSPIDRLYVKGVPTKRETTEQFFNEVKEKAERALQYGEFRTTDPTTPMVDKSAIVTLATLFAR